MTKSNEGKDLINDIKNKRKAEKFSKVKVFGRALGFTAYGTATLISLTYATLSAFGHELIATQLHREIVITSIVVTAEPVLQRLGQIIWNGILGMAAKEDK